MRRYHIQDREDYHKCVSLSPSSLLLVVTEVSRPWSSRYNKLCGSLRSYAHRLSLLPAQDPFRSKMEGQLLSKLYDMGVLNTTAKLSDIENKLTVAAFCRRRLAVIMCMSKMAETVSAVCVVVSLDFTLCCSVFPIRMPSDVAVGPALRHLAHIPDSASWRTVLLRVMSLMRDMLWLVASAIALDKCDTCSRMIVP